MESFGGLWDVGAAAGVIRAGGERPGCQSSAEWAVGSLGSGWVALHMKCVLSGESFTVSGIG